MAAYDTKGTPNLIDIKKNDNTTAKMKLTYIQTIVLKAQHLNLRTEQHESQ